MDLEIKKISIPDFKEWKKSLKEFIKTEIVPRVLPGKSTTIDKYRELLITENAMSVWIPAFTHPSFDSTTDHNFEVFEYVGDKFLYYTLSVYAKKKYPYFNQDDLTNFNINFTSRDPLAEISIKTGLVDHIRTIQTLTSNKEKSDIFEAVIGALLKIGDEQISPGIGYMIVYNYVTSIYNWYDNLTAEMKEGTIINQVLQGYYDALGWREHGQSGKIFESWNPETKTMTLYLNDKAVKMLTDLDKRPKNVVLYQGKDRAILAEFIGANKKEAEEGVYREALKILKSVYKITPEDAKKLSIKLYLDSLVKTEKITEEEAKDLFKKVMDQNLKYGMLWNKTEMVETKEGKMYVLLGKRTDNNVEVLIRIGFEDESLGESLYRLYLYRVYTERGKMKDSFSYFKIKKE